MKLAILGATGSIGTQALEILRFHRLRPVILTGGKNDALMESLAREFLPSFCYMADEKAGKALAEALRDTSVTVRWDEESLLEAASYAGCNRVLNALPGLSGLPPTLAALRAGKKLLLANKESLVCGGDLVTALAQTPILPVDSEHSAIFQCLQGGRQGLRQLILTASGGAFRGYTREKLQNITPEMALCHPNWSMGAKVTLDSATLLNKGLELIEAMVLFGLPSERISVVVHPQSIVHSLVEYNDGAMVAQLGTPDMRTPIQYALFYPERKPCPSPPLSLTDMGALTFETPDTATFPCLTLARRAAEQGGNAGAVLSGAGEGAAEAFLAGRCQFLEIPDRIERALQTIQHWENPTLEDILQSAGEAYRLAAQ